MINIENAKNLQSDSWRLNQAYIYFISYNNNNNNNNNKNKNNNNKNNNNNINKNDKYRQRQESAARSRNNLQPVLATSQQGMYICNFIHLCCL